MSSFGANDVIEYMPLSKDSHSSKHQWDAAISMRRLASPNKDISGRIKFFLSYGKICDFLHNNLLAGDFYAFKFDAIFELEIKFKPFIFIFLLKAFMNKNISIIVINEGFESVR